MKKDLIFTKGDTYAISFTLEGFTGTLTEAYFTCKENPTDAPKFQKRLNNGITLVEGTKYKVQIESADTASMVADYNYLYDIEIIVDNVRKTIIGGYLTLNEEITKYNDEKITITFNSNGGSEVLSQVINKGSNCLEPSDPTKANYTFVEWRRGEEITPFSFDTTLYNNTTLNAIWEANE